jgi:hypothetical protein
MNGETYFQDPASLSHTSLIGVTYEIVTLCALTWLISQTRDLVSIWRHIGVSRASPFDATQSCQLLWRDWQTCSFECWSSRAMLNDATHEGVAPTTMVWLIERIWLPSFYLSSSSLSLFLPSPLLTLWRLHWWFRVLHQNPSLWCEKLTPWVGILIVLGTYIVFTLSFCCILKFSFG